MKRDKIVFAIGLVGYLFFMIVAIKIMGYKTETGNMNLIWFILDCVAVGGFCFVCAIKHLFKIKVRSKKG